MKFFLFVFWGVFFGKVYRSSGNTLGLWAFLLFPGLPGNS